ncbi:hypothetical protein SAMN04487866_101273 [Thermoactinomyces sp. DSM 45891]|uniref:hypothetical protein n=1 Tax=Thermoactinomyces sp. DSM 45891 TaxID=1761907 RepID=UPI000920D13C|nr:hypothetical protein [Thermoactinomyces sp. DSM 45891]SFX03417.1 hypothetical protein SAMN04487866_101273 [Thermoactinomyces sp. DSM 45891]
MEKKILANGIRLSGTVQEIRDTLQEWGHLPITLQEWIEAHHAGRPHLIPIRSRKGTRKPS